MDNYLSHCLIITAVALGATTNVDMRQQDGPRHLRRPTLDDYLHVELPTGAHNYLREPRELWYTALVLCDGYVVVNSHVGP